MHHKNRHLNHSKPIKMTPREHMFAQAKFRIVIAAVISLYYFSLFLFENTSTIQEKTLPFMVFLNLYAIASVLYCKSARTPDIPIITLIIDIGLTAITFPFAGFYATLYYPVFLWVIIGYGVRYGKKYLTIASIWACVIFAASISTSSLWRENIPLSLGLFGGLFIIPLYLQVLLKQLHRALADAEIASQVKSDFLAHMSHELRTPLTGIIASSDMLKEEHLEGSAQNKVDMISSSATSLLSMIRGVLDISKAESGQLELSYTNTTLLSILKNLESFMAPLADKNKLDFVIDFDPEMFKQASIPKTEVQQILVNFVGNAIKFTDIGSVTVKGKHELIDGNPGWRIEVEDTGIGIDESILETIFDPFVQADTSATRKYSGTGLGTTISKQFIELMAGQVGAISEPGKGSKFWFKIPVEYVDAETVSLDVSPTIFSINLTDTEYQEARDIFSGCLINNIDFSSPDKTIQQLSKVKTPLILSGKDLSNHRFDTIRSNLQKNELSHIPFVRFSQENSRLFSKYVSGHKELTLSIKENSDINVARAILNSVIHTKRKVENLVPMRRLNILVADDAETNRDILNMMLSSEGHIITSVIDGSQALSALCDINSNFDIAILDRNMPGLDGIDVVRHHRTTNALSNSAPRFMLLTADATEKTRIEAIDAGLDGFLTKPFLAEDLKNEIFRILPDSYASKPAADGKTKLELAVDNTKTHESVESDVDYINESTLQDLYNMSSDGEVFLQRMINSFLKDAAQMKIEMNEAFENQNYIQLLDAAHALKGVATQIGAVEMASFTNKMNKISRIEFDREYCSTESENFETTYNNTILAIQSYATSLEITLNQSETK